MAGIEVNSDDEFIVPPMKRARTVVSGGNLFHGILLHVQLAPSLNSIIYTLSQSTLSVDTARIWIL